MMYSDESNDIMLDHPDIENIEQKRDMDKENNYDLMLYKQMNIPLKRLEQEKKELLHQQKLEAKRIAEEKALKARKEKALKGMKYLLTLSEKYSNFFSERIHESSKTKKKQPLKEQNKLQPTIRDMAEVANSGNDLYINENIDVNKQLKYFEGGTLLPYQIEGVSWMAMLRENGINGILADEMGLGKTIQVIALICHLLEKSVNGPFLIVAPLSTLTNWESEFKRFAPQVPLVVFYGDFYQRTALRQQIKRKYKIGSFYTMPVILTSYEMPIKEENVLNRFDFEYIIVDEGQRIKNHEAMLSKALRRLASANRLLLTGTPLQNNIQELWSLLNFTMPQIFKNIDTFASLIMLEDVKDGKKLLEQEEKNNVISTLHKVLTPFMLRRLKKDVLIDIVPKKEVYVYCPLTDFQKKLYSYVIDTNIKELMRQKDDPVTQFQGSIDFDRPKKKRKCTQQSKNYTYLNCDYDSSFIEISDDEDDNETIANTNVDQGLLKENNIEKNQVEFVVRLTMQNKMMMYRKIVNHPYLVHFPLDPKYKKRKLLINEDIINYSGKMLVLDAMLAKLKERGHKVLIFSTLVMTIDLIEELMLMRNYNYRRLDGSHKLEMRTKSISDFNNDPDVLAFMISTRAGGVGLNLTGADTVIFFDRDWNPQADIQAQDRCHRIGQTKPVMVYTLVSKNTIDDIILKRGQQKRILEKLVIKDGKFKNLGQSEKIVLKSELEELKLLLNSENQKFEEILSNKQLDQLMDRSDLYAMMNKK